ncbi:GxxExxY protein [Niabella pedocola]|uniref:GxxExxY protein n=1 Tax=Niabella pedocola TaxID=1752077 RepID=A0ABS8PR33_9BACT|nr:GxxExxY protein [Niabella pedocola]MCD2423554.1 GxxExxY protein [Niabella pedocola]
MLTENEIATKVLDLCFKIHRHYGPGLFESVYEEILCFELKKAGISFERQIGIPLIHETVRMEVGFRADLIVEEIVLFELKSIEACTNVHYKQVLTYLKLTDLKLGVMVNFNVSLLKNEIKRIVNKL